MLWKTGGRTDWIQVGHICLKTKHICFILEFILAVVILPVFLQIGRVLVHSCGDSFTGGRSFFLYVTVCSKHRTCQGRQAHFSVWSDVDLKNFGKIQVLQRPTNWIFRDAIKWIVDVIILPQSVSVPLWGSLWRFAPVSQMNVMCGLNIYTLILCVTSNSALWKSVLTELCDRPVFGDCQPAVNVDPLWMRFQWVGKWHQLAQRWLLAWDWKTKQDYTWTTNIYPRLRVLN